MKFFLQKFVILFMVFAISSCTNEESIEQESSEVAATMDLEKLTENYKIENINASVKYFEGNVDSKILEEMVVLLIGEPGNYKSSFRIQMTDDILEEFSNIESDNFRIAHFGRDLILSNEEETFYFTVDQQPIFQKIAADAEVIHAFGIANWTSPKFKTSSTDTVALNLIVKEASCTCKSVLEDEAPCQSGGSGSTSCSQGDCSVSCGGGHYACCNG